jgi:hypothetical protein
VPSVEFLRLHRPADLGRVRRLVPFQPRRRRDVSHATILQGLWRCCRAPDGAGPSLGHAVAVGARPNPVRSRHATNVVMIMLRLLGVLTMLVTLGTAPVALAIVLNVRDRREDRLLGTVAPEVSRMRGIVALRVRCAALWPKSIARLDMWLCKSREMWGTSLRVLERLPSGVRLIVEGPVSGELVARLTLVARGKTRSESPGGRHRGNSRRNLVS